MSKSLIIDNYLTGIRITPSAQPLHAVLWYYPVLSSHKVFTLRAVDILGKPHARTPWTEDAAAHFTSCTQLAAQPLFVSIPHVQDSGS